MTSATRVTIGTAAGAGTLIATNSQSWQDGAGRRIALRFALAQVGTAGTVWVGGGTDVSTANGFPFVMTGGAATASPFIVTLEPGESIYAIASQSGGTIAVFSMGN